MVTMVVIVRRFVWRRSIFHHPTSSVFDFFSYFCIIFLNIIDFRCYLSIVGWVTLEVNQSRAISYSDKYL